MFRSIARWGPYPPLTVALVVVSVLVSVGSNFGSARDIVVPLFIAALEQSREIATDLGNEPPKAG